MYAKPTLVKIGTFERLTMHSRPVKRDRSHRRRERRRML